MTLDELLTRVVQITDAVEVPVSVDIESGYGEGRLGSSTGLLMRAPSVSTSRTPCTARAAGCGPR
jgi:hypothetical protein